MEGLGIEGAGFGLAEVFLALPFGIGDLNLNPLAFEGNALGFVGLTLEAGDIGAEVAEAALAGFGVGVFGVEGAEGDGGVVEREPAGEFVGEGAGQRVIAEGFFVVEVVCQGEGVVAGDFSGAGHGGEGVRGLVDWWTDAEGSQIRRPKARNPNEGAGGPRADWCD
jgi:hypothetical protein